MKTILKIKENINYAIKKIPKSKFLMFVVGFLIIAIPAFVIAQTSVPTEYTLLEPLPDPIGGGSKTSISGAEYINMMFRLAIAIAAILAVIMIIYGGILYATSDAVYTKKEGKEKIRGAVIGLILVLASYLILYTIDPNYVKFNLNLEKVTIKPQKLDLNLGSQAQNKFDTSLDTINSNLDKIKVLKADVSKLNSDLKTADQGNINEINRIKNSIAEKEKQIAVLTAENNTKMAISSVYNNIEQFTSLKIPASKIETAITYANEKYITEVNKLKTKGYSEEAQKLENERNYTVATMEIDKFFVEEANKFSKLAAPENSIIQTTSFLLSHTLSGGPLINNTYYNLKENVSLSVLENQKKEIFEKSAGIFDKYVSEIKDTELQKKMVSEIGEKIKTFKSNIDTVIDSKKTKK